MNRRRLALELHRYLAAETSLDPPPEPSADPAPSGSDPAAAEESSGRNAEGESPQDRLDRLTDSARGCEQCSLSENRRQVVFGEGTARARIMVIGEAPGAREDEQGRPFVGPAGELLRGGFEKIGFDPDALYITNTVKCRPPDNRNPREEELAACRPYLDRQLDIIDPPVVLPLGNFGLRYCLGSEERIGDCRGEVYEWEDRLLTPTYHPAYILRNPSQAQTFINDLKRAVDCLEDV